MVVPGAFRPFILACLLVAPSAAMAADGAAAPAPGDDPVLVYLLLPAPTLIVLPGLVREASVDEEGTETFALLQERSTRPAPRIKAPDTFFASDGDGTYARRAAGDALPKKEDPMSLGEQILLPLAVSAIQAFDAKH